MMTEVSLGWREGPSIEEILPALRRLRHLRRLTLRIWNSSITRSETLCDFILGLKQLSFLELFFNRVQSETLRHQVKKIVLPRRPIFTLILNAY